MNSVPGAHRAPGGRHGLPAAARQRARHPGRAAPAVAVAGAAHRAQGGHRRARRTNLALARAYNNLAVPGATAARRRAPRTTDNGGLHDLILRGRGTPGGAGGGRAAQRRHALDRQQRRAGGGGARPRHRRRDADAGRRLPRRRIQQLIDGAAARPAPASSPPTCRTSPASRSSPPSRRCVVNPTTGQPVLVERPAGPAASGPTGPLPPGSLVTLARLVAAGRRASASPPPSAAAARRCPTR